MNNLIEHIDMYIMYIVLGYVFLKTFQFVASRQDKSLGIESKLISSFIVGYVYYKICNAIPWHISNEIDMVGIFASAVIFAIILGKIISSNTFINKILIAFNMRQTANEYIWDDLFGDYSMNIIVKYNDVTYDGFFHLVEQNNNSPHIVLGSYVEYDKNGDVINDKRDSNDQLIVLDLANAISVEVKYFKEDKACQLIQNMCDSRNSMYPKNDI